ncbi:helix-turn-helix transcriptional regulator [Pirellulaceae bacterium SH467]
MKLLTIRQVCFMLGISRTGFYNLRRQSDFPEPRFGKRWLQSDVEKWLHKKPVQFCSIDSAGLAADITTDDSIDRIQS